MLHTPPRQPAESVQTVYGLLGYPLGHSYSARFFAEKFRREGIPAVYLNFELPTADLLRAEVVDRHPRLRGFNVTIPHKRAIIPQLSSLSAEAEAIGAVNVVRVERDAGGTVRLSGHNTDWIGFAGSLRPLLRPADTDALVLGGRGGAAAAVTYGLRRLGLCVHPVSRRSGEGVADYASLTPEVMERCSVIVNCTPLGMSPRVETLPDIPYSCLTDRHLLYDLVYNPGETLFLRRGIERGARVKNGAEMLRRQALAAWDIWQGGVPAGNE